MNRQENESFEGAPDRARPGRLPGGRAQTEVLRVIDVMGKPQPIVPLHILMGAARKIARLRSADVLIVEDKGSLVGFLDARSLRDAPGGGLMAHPPLVVSSTMTTLHGYVESACRATPTT
jgi:hypothetical protein